ncbi:MAG: NUDIX domain-containing protein [Chitinophagaceae bacterium]|nr:NUDIX domain-containing protein [Chitinophagaceae bacterium]
MAVKIYFEDDFKLIEDTTAFFKDYTLITAAGGLVINDEGKILMIFRRGKWDLPKGKLDDGELLEVCAEREVKEETGLSEITLIRFLSTTYHTYTENGKQILKDTHWYLFRAYGHQDITPQTEEQITETEWIGQDELTAYKEQTYALIRDVLNTAGY